MVENKTKALKMKDDIMFKAFFSKIGNEIYLKELLNSILGEKFQIKKVVHDARLEQLAKENKYGVLDLEVELETNKIVNVELQLRDYHNIEERTTFYAGKKIGEQLGPNQDYKEMKKVIIIAILDYSFIDLPEYITDTVRVAKQNKEYELNNQVEYIYIELEKFRKQNPNMKEAVNQWLAFLDMERGDLLEMAIEENEKIKEAVKSYNELSGDEEVKRLAEVRLMGQLEEKAALASARAKGEEKGFAIGEAEGRKKGEAEGRKKGEAEGRKKGEAEEKEKIAKKMKAKNISINEIMELTGLSKEKIESI